MPAGEPFSDAQLREINHAVAEADRETGLHFSVFIGPVDGAPRAYAERLHAATGPRASLTVLLAVFPGERVVEIVTGEQSARRLNERSCGLAGMSMSSSFAGGDLVGGVVNGVRMLAEAAGRVAAPA